MKLLLVFLFVLPLLSWEYYHHGQLETLEPIPSTVRSSIVHYFKTKNDIEIGVDNRVIFKPKNEICKEKTLSLYKNHFVFSNGHIVIELKDAKEAFDVAKELYESGCALFSHPDFLVFPKKRSLDPLFPQQWNFHNVGQYGIVRDIDMDVYEAWQFATGRGVKVALIDNGFDFSHPDLRDVFVDSIDLVDYDTDPSYDNNYELHGTACAGLIGARKNERGVIGAAYESKIVGIKLIGSYPSGEDRPLYVSDIVRSFLYANDAGAHVINCSWGTYDVADAVRDVIEYVAYNGRDGKGVPIVFASGNEGRGQWYWANDESALPCVLAIGAVTDQNEVAWYSNYGPALDFVAPSGGGFLRIATTDIVGSLGYADGSYGHPDYCYATDYTGFNGTSAAAPQVSGVIALMIERNPDLTRDEIVDILKRTAKKVGTIPYIDGRNDYMGYGLVNADDAVKEAIRKKVVDTVKGKEYAISGYFIRIGSDAFDWVYIDVSKTVVAKLDGMSEDGGLIWNPVLKGAFSSIDIDNGNVIFGERLIGSPLAQRLAGEIFSLQGYFTRFGLDRYDWIYVDRRNSKSYKLEGLDYNNYFLWIDLFLRADVHDTVISFR